MRYDNQPELDDGNEILHDRDARVINAASQLIGTVRKMKERAGVATPDQYTEAINRQFENVVAPQENSAEQDLMAQTAEIVGEEAARLANIRSSIESIHLTGQNNPLFGDKADV